MHSPKEMLSPRLRDALPKAGTCMPPGMPSLRPRDALPKELCLPTTAAQSSSCQLRSWGGGGWQPGLPPPKRCRMAAGPGREVGVPGVAPLPYLLPALPHRRCPAPQRTPGLPPSPRPRFRMHLAPPPLETCQLLTRGIAARGSIRALTPSIVKWPLGTLPWGFKGSIQGATSGSLHHHPPLVGAYPRVQTPRGWGGRAGRFGRGDGDGKQ